MTVVWKFNFTPDRDAVPINMPKGAKPLHVGRDPEGTPAIWAEVDAHEVEKEQRVFFVVGTGHHVPTPAEHLGSFNHGPYVWHIYYHRRTT